MVTSKIDTGATLDVTKKKKKKKKKKKENKKKKKKKKQSQELHRCFDNSIVRKINWIKCSDI